MKTPAVVIDDDRINIKLICGLLREYCPGVAVVGTATNLEDGVKAIIDLRPGIVFLDIQLHNRTGFDLLKCVDTSRLVVILVTAYEKYTIQAVRTRQVIDYLLKPISIEQLINAVKNAKEELWMMTGQNTHSEISTPVIGVINHLLNDDIANIIRLEGLGNYTRVYSINKDSHTTTKTLKEYEDLFPGHVFIRVHKSHIINLNHVQDSNTLKKGYILMKDGSEIPVSERKMKMVSLIFGQ